MKKLLIILFLTASAIYAQELTADSPAIAPTVLDQVLQAVLAAVGATLIWLMKNAIPLLNTWLRQSLHFRNSAIVADAVTEALAEIGNDIAAHLADGVLTDAEKQQIKDKAKAIAKIKFERLAGFYKHDLSDYIDEQIKVALGKLLAQV